VGQGDEQGRGGGGPPERDVADLFDTTGEGIVLRVHVQPRAGRDVVTGRHGDALKVRVTAAPTDGRANDAVARLLAASFGVAPSTVELVSGWTSRTKRFRLAGVTAADARDRLRDLLRPATGNNGGASTVER
jgi:uncharacterized protein (TIGR00251 family)